jgi:ribosomal protein S18 acetylase RimI-like enzyme
MQVRVARDDDFPLAARLLHDFNVEFDEPTPDPATLAARLRALPDTTVLLIGEVGVVVLRFQPSLWTDKRECYLAELYVRPDERGHGLGETVLRAALDHARQEDADYLHLGTSEDDVAARHLYEKVGMRRTEGDAGPLMFVYEIEL